MTQTTIIISGIHSDPDPSPGIGIARSIREAFPDATIVGVDYSLRSSGLHHPVFNRIEPQPGWGEMDLATYAVQVRSHLNLAKGCWISGLDVEIKWLSMAVGDHPRLLIPNASAQKLAEKPEIAASNYLGMRVPEFLPASAPPTDLHALGRRSGWHLWVKGKYHEAYPAFGFSELYRKLRSLELHWPINDVFVQRHVSGLERSIVFAAYRGRLLDAVETEKRIVTSQGKTQCH